jgi:methyl-accepting chemotaxis protein
MTLRHKFGMLALMYAIALATNVALCSWSLLLYYQTFMGQTAAEPFTTVAAETRQPVVEESAVTGNWFSNEALAVQVLAINAACGIGVGLLGLRLVRRWVLLPVAQLRESAVELGRGDLSHRARVSSRDELGSLATEVNEMASNIVRMQSELVEQERRQVAAQALRCIVHNIRSPLTGVRWLAEAITMRHDVDAETVSEQGRIMQAVDGILSWLQGFRESLEKACHRAPPADCDQDVENNRTREVREA